MSGPKTFFPIETERLVLREWRDADRELLAVMNADPLQPFVLYRIANPGHSRSISTNISEETNP